LKKLFKNKILIKFISVVFSVVILANIKANNNPRFIANQGQFNKGVKFKLEHRAGNIYFENNNVKFDLFQKDKINALKHGDISVGNIFGHVYESNFIGYNKEVKILGHKKTNNFCNYLLEKTPVNGNQIFQFIMSYYMKIYILELTYLTLKAVEN
jgi:hypothetical protein